MHERPPGLWPARPPRQIVGPQIDRKGGQTQHDADPEGRRMVNAPPVARGRVFAHDGALTAAAPVLVGEFDAGLGFGDRLLDQIHRLDAVAAFVGHRFAQ